MGVYKIQIGNLTKKVPRRFKGLSKNVSMSIYQAQSKLQLLQKKITEELSLSVYIDNGIKEFEVTEVKIDPYGEPFQLMDILYSQFLMFSTDELDGGQIYMEMNRQYIKETEGLPSPRPRQLRRFPKKGSSFFNTNI